MARQVLFDDGLNKLIKGIETLAEAVKVTLGPKGRYVVIETDYYTPHPTKDGVTVAKHVKLEDPVENLGAEMIKQAAQRTGDEAGDGTTTSTVIAHTLIKEGFKLIKAGVPPIEIKRELEKGLKKVIDELNSMIIKATPQLVAHIANIASNSDEEITNLVIDAYDKATFDGVITVEDSKYNKSYVEKVNGFSFEQGIASTSLFSSPSDTEVTIENPLIFLYDDKVRSSEDIIPIMRRVAEKYENRPMLIIADDFDPQAIQLMAINNKKSNFRFYAVKSPSWGQNRDAILEDIAIVTGAIVVSNNDGIHIKQATTDFLGECEQVRITQTHTFIVGGKGDEQEIKARINQITESIQPTNTEWENDYLKERKARLTGGAAKIFIFAPTPTELKDKKDRLDDTLHAVRNAAIYGILPGGGMSYYRASKVLDNSFGQSVLSKALKEPFKSILRNAGYSDGRIIERIENVAQNGNKVGFDANLGDVTDMIERGIVDSVKVATEAVTNAVSVAATVLMTAVVMPNIPDTQVDLSTPPTLPVDQMD